MVQCDRVFRLPHPWGEKYGHPPYNIRLSDIVPQKDVLLQVKNGVIIIYLIFIAVLFSSGKGGRMGTDSYKLSTAAALAVPADHADKLLSLGDGGCALLYLYALRCGGAFSLKKAAADLRRTENEISKAAETLRQSGLFSPSAGCGFVPPPAEELPDYTAEDITASTGENGEFKIIVNEAQRILGKMLSGADLKILFAIYDYLRLPAEVIILLLNHCVEEYQGHSAAGRLPSMRYVEKEAYVWHNREILTLEQAEEYLQHRQLLRQEQEAVKQLLQIKGRSFSATEKKYVESWLELGFQIDAIALAYDKTLVKTGKLAWEYMNSILQNWHKKDLHTAAQVETGDKRPGASEGGSAENAPTGVKRDDSRLLNQILNRPNGE